MDDIAEQLAIRDSFRRKLALRKTPDERAREMWPFHQSMWNALRRSPAGYAHFLRRNFRKRAVDVENRHEL